jgi:ribosomal protein L11 methyltransferase
MYELVLRAPQALVETVSDQLMEELEALSVSVEDADADSANERALFGEPGMPPPAAGWDRSTLKALFDTEAAAESAAAWLLAQHDGAGLHLQALAVMADQDWVRLTQQQFQPVSITHDFWVVPSWHEVPAQARTVLRLDPGLAFGTGTHPTTRMCLRWLARQAAGPAPARVLDYGCGSGILAIAAALLGAAQIDAVDIDPAAVQASVDNARHNGVAVQTAPDAAPGQVPAAAQPTQSVPPTQSNGPVLRCGLPDLAQGPYDLVLANILATPLKLLAPLLSAHVAPGGWLVMAGILQRQAQDLQATYAGHLHASVTDEEDGWVLMCAQRPLRAGDMPA